MAVIPINLARISQNLRSFNLLQSTRQTNAGLFRAQNQIATGLKFASASEDPIGAAQVQIVDRQLDKLTQVERNLQAVNSQLTTTESAMQEAIDLLIEAQTITTSAVGDTISSEERQSLVTVVERIVDQLISVGNRQHLDAFLFAGDYRGEAAPYEWLGDGVIYRGDDGRGEAIIASDLAQDSFTISGERFFRAVSPEVRGVVDLNPQVTRDTRLSQLRGAAGQGVQLGTISVVESGAQYDIDLSGAATVGDVLDRLNAELPATLTAFHDANGIGIGYSGAATPVFEVADVGGNTAARDLGISTNGGPGPVPTANLDPTLSLQTSLADLGVNVLTSLGDGLIVENGSRSATISFDGAQTIEDVLNRINAADLGVDARIAPDGRTLEVRNRISGSNLRIGENGGNLAELLGIRSMVGATSLSELNDGQGVRTEVGDDLRITTADGSTFDFDLDGLESLQAVIDLLNTGAGGAITAGLNASGNGLDIRDNTVGGGVFAATRLNVSPALSDLGLDVAAVGGVINGRDVNPIRVDSPFTALLELRDGMQRDDTRTIQQAGARLERMLSTMLESQGQIAAQAKKMDERSVRLENELTTAQIALSDVRDADLTETITRFQQLQTALQANYQTAARVADLNLLNFLR